MRVQIRNLQTLPVDEALLADAARATLRVAGGELGAAEIAIVDDRRIRAVNREYRNCDLPTDVIAFEAEDGPAGRVGEIIISAETADRQAQEAGQSLQAELCLLVAHGVLHALGYEDHNEPARARMRALQERALESVAERLSQHER
ncbi:MAG: rRNA maturation RNase YbeY [Armatimonadota bacterium]